MIRLAAITAKVITGRAVGRHPLSKTDEVLGLGRPVLIAGK
jgi:hypothetical protein